MGTDELISDDIDNSARCSDRKWMQQTLDLASQARGHVEPNPMVGSLIARNSQLIGRGYHEVFGGPHAEVNAINNAIENGHSRFDDATLYVNLEPCSHHGKTPPCVELLLKHRVGRVVIGTTDPNPNVAGTGIELLKGKGVDVVCGILETQARNLNAAFFKLQEVGRPWVIAKWAMTLDGKIATRTGDSKWISSDRAREAVHEMRARMDAIIVGSETALVDDPMLNARLPDTDLIARVATRVVVDSRCRLPVTSKLASSSKQFPTLVATTNSASAESIGVLRGAGCEVIELESNSGHVDLQSLLNELGRRQMTNVLVEGGGTLLGGLFDANLIDEVHVFIAPTIVGGGQAKTPIAGLGIEQMEFASRLANVDIQQLDSDIYLRGRIKNVSVPG